jgi:hypothetical protein
MEINDEALERRIERIVDERVEKRLTEFFDRGRARTNATEDGSGADNARRRSVLKALGVGAVGFGAGVVPCVADDQLRPAPAPSENGQAQRENVGLVARPGQIQSRIDEAAAGPNSGRVVLQPGIEYDPEDEIHVRGHVTLDFNGGMIAQTGDHNTLFVDHGARIYDGLIDRSTLGPSAASAAVLLDTGRAGNDYRNAAGDYTGVSVECNVLGAGVDSEGVGLQLVGEGDLGIDLGNEFDMQIRDCGKGVDVYTERYLNGPLFRLGLTGNRIDIDHRGTDVFNSTIHGWIQPEPGSEVGIRNQTDSQSVAFVGEFWDPSAYDRNSLEGSSITVLSLAADAQDFTGTTDGRDYTAVQSWDSERREIYNAASDSTFEARYDAGIIQYRVNGTRIMDIGEDYVRIRGQLVR